MSRGSFAAPAISGIEKVSSNGHIFGRLTGGLPSEWTIAGTNTFGSKVAEHFVYPKFGIQPFVAAPTIAEPSPAKPKILNKGEANVRIAARENARAL